MADQQPPDEPRQPRQPSQQQGPREPRSPSPDQPSQDDQQPPGGDQPRGPSAPPPPPGQQQPPQRPHGPPPGRTPGVGAWLSEAWELFAANWGNCILMMLVPLVPIVIAILILVLAGLPSAIAEAQGSGGIARSVAAGSVMIGVVVAAAFLLIVMPAIQVGVYACFWEMIRTRRLTFDRITDGLALFASALGMGLLFGIMHFVVGIVLNIIPVIGQLAAFVIGFPLMAWMMLAFYEMAVQQKGAFDCMSAGWQLMSVDFWNLVLLAFLAWLINAAGGLACGIGVLVSGPITIAAWALAYRDMRG